MVNAKDLQNLYLEFQLNEIEKLIIKCNNIGLHFIQYTLDNMVPAIKNRIIIELSHSGFRVIDKTTYLEIYW